MASICGACSLWQCACERFLHAIYWIRWVCRFHCAICIDKNMFSACVYRIHALDWCSEACGAFKLMCRVRYLRFSLDFSTGATLYRISSGQGTEKKISIQFFQIDYCSNWLLIIVVNLFEYPSPNSRRYHPAYRTRPASITLQQRTVLW